MEVKELKDSFPGVMPLIDDLYKEKKLIMMRGKDGTPKIVYFNDPSLKISISDEFKQKWNQAIIPPDMDLVSELKKLGMKAMVLEDKKKVASGVYILLISEKAKGQKR